MEAVSAAIEGRDFEPGLAGRIPIRNVFVLLLYASGLARFEATLSGALDEAPEGAASDLHALLARMLVYAVRHRLRRNLSRGYVGREAVLTRVRGRIDLRATLLKSHLERGRVACRFEELTVDTPRNRLVRTALARSATRLDDADLAAQCRGLARELGDVGVGRDAPSKAEMSRDVIGRNDVHDRLMVSCAKLLIVPELPWARDGDRSQAALVNDLLFWKIYEAAVARILAQHLSARVEPQGPRFWPLTNPTSGAMRLWPRMAPDIFVHREDGSTLVIDTKFTSMTNRRYDVERFKAAHLYQLFTYLAAGQAIAKGPVEGLLLYPKIGGEPDEEAATIGMFRLRLATVDLAAAAQVVVDRIVSLASRTG